ncbi:MAG: glutamate synthase-related protein [Candidatus Methanomethyliaceae archaeon]|nr:glutamate synthase-related protein [Candidatus Methanomethyliaceae archaeon]
MAYLKNSSYLNAMSTTRTRIRVNDPCPSSGLCPLCIRECSVICEVSLSAFRGREALYPDPAMFGKSTAGSLKDYGLDWSHFNIKARLLEAYGIDANPDSAIFPNVDVETSVGGIRLKLPVMIGAYGSTEVARVNWDGLAIGGALSGIIVTIGENVCGVDLESVITGGKVVHSPELKRRVDAFRKFWDEKYGEIAVQTNVEDQRLGVDVYAISSLEVNIIERKWGQGAKAIGGEIRVSDLEKAIALKKRGYVVIPDPEDKGVQEAFKQGIFKTFERHSRVGIPMERDFIEDIEWLREQGAKKVSLKTGNYEPAAVAFTMKVASDAKIDYVVFDGAGGGTGMSPVPMMNEMGTPTVYLEAQVLKCAEILRKKGKHVPDIVMAGGFMDETQIFKAIAMSNFNHVPYVKSILMGRAPLTAVMKASYFAELAKKDQLPRQFEELFGNSPEKFFIYIQELKEMLGDKFKEVPWGAIGLYTYMDRIKVGLQQLMAGARKWKLNLLDRSDLIALTERAAKATGIPLPEEETHIMEQMLS